MLRQLSKLCIPLAVLLPLQPALAQGAGSFPAPPPVVMTDGYVLGVGDIIEVSVLGREEYHPRVQIQADGTVQLPYINTIPAANKTVQQLQNFVQQALKSGGYYSNPAVSVMVVNNASRYAIVLGEVTTPGLVPLERVLHVSEVIARVGGTRGLGADVITLRRQNGETLTMTMADVAAGSDATDPVVNPGDKVYVAPPKQFYIYGQVNAPGTYPIDRDMTLRKALARGGGLTQLGSEHKVKVYRDGQKIKDFDFAQPILPSDVVVVGERFF